MKKERRRAKGKHLLGWFLFLLGSSGQGVEATGGAGAPGGQVLYTSAYLLRVNLCDTTDLTPVTFSELMREVSAIYSSAGVQIVWQHECGSGEIAGELARLGLPRVYLLREIPAPIVFRKRRFERLPVMGYALTTPGGAPGPVVYVSRKAVEKHVRVDASKPSLLARALGRLVAHELAHRFLQSRHISEGILREEIARKDWIDEDPRDLYFTEEQVTYLRSVAEKDPPPFKAVAEK